MSIETQAELDALARVGRVVALALARLSNEVRPGVTTQARRPAPADGSLTATENPRVAESAGPRPKEPHVPLGTRSV